MKNKRPSLRKEAEKEGKRERRNKRANENRPGCYLVAKKKARGRGQEGIGYQKKVGRVVKKKGGKGGIREQTETGLGATLN